MWRRTIGLAITLSMLVAGAAHAQGAPLRITLDSGTVARLSWQGDTRQQVLLTSDFAPTSDSVRFCRYPASGCGSGSVNPIQTRPATSLRTVEVRRGNHVFRGALWGAAVGVFLTAYDLAWIAADERHPSTGRTVGIVALTLGGSIGFGALLGSGGHDWVAAGQ